MTITVGQRPRPGLKRNGFPYRTREWYFIDPASGVKFGGYSTKGEALAAAAARREASA
jgi:hypothetical protein